MTVATYKQVAAPVTWMRVNRMLAWALLVSPVVQIALGTPFSKGLWIDLGLLAIHCVMSLVLFGMPRAPAGDSWMVWLGVAPGSLSPRNKFLMSGWRIALACGSLLLMLVGLVPWFLLLLTPLYLIARLPFSVLGHVYGAASYAFRRWGADAVDAGTWAFCTAAAFVIANTLNLFR